MYRCLPGSHCSQGGRYVISRSIAASAGVAAKACRSSITKAAGGPVPGLVYTSDVTFPRTKAYLSRLVTALAAADLSLSTNYLSV